MGFKSIIFPTEKFFVVTEVLLRLSNDKNSGGCEWTGQ